MGKKQEYKYLVNASVRRRGAIGVFWMKEFEITSPRVLATASEAFERLLEVEGENWEISHVESWWGK